VPSMSVPVSTKTCLRVPSSPTTTMITGSTPTASTQEQMVTASYAIGDGSALGAHGRARCRGTVTGPFGSATHPTVPRLRSCGAGLSCARRPTSQIEQRGVQVSHRPTVPRDGLFPAARRVASSFAPGWRLVRRGVIQSEGTGGGVDCRLFGRDHCPAQGGRDYECAAATREISHVGLTTGQLAEHRLRVVSDVPALVADTDVRHRTTVSAHSARWRVSSPTTVRSRSEPEDATSNRTNATPEHP
jgi:hypothetical protein